MKKLFFRASTILLLAAALTACSKDYWEEINATTAQSQDQQFNAYMSFSFEMPNTDTRAPAADGQDGDTPSFNHVGEWGGQDKIKNATIYVFKGTDEHAMLEKAHKFLQSDLQQPQWVSGRWMVKPLKAFPISAGQKTVYIVINAVPSTDNHLPHNEGSTTLGEFQSQYEKVALTLASSTTGKGSADVLAEETQNAEDFITMTGPAQEIGIAPNVSEATATSGLQNSVSITFRRAVARVLVTSLQEKFTFKGNVPDAAASGKVKEENDAIGVSNLHFVVAQGEKQLYLLQQPRPAADPQGAAFNSPAFDKKMTRIDYGSDDYKAEYSAIGQYYDYASLWYERPASPTSPTSRIGHLVDERDPVSSDPKTEISKVEKTVKLGNRSAFLLPTLHKFDGTREQTGYCKGNTAYVLVRGRIEPKKYIDASGNVADGSNLADDDPLYYGLETGLFYATQDQVTDATHYGKANQKAYVYKKRKVLYFAWINPDNASEPVNSPVIRNNVYHLHIKAINKLGANWNPLVPNGVSNPDPFPTDNPLEPKEPRLYPHDPLSLKKGDTSVWMSVTVVKSPLRIFSHSFNP